MGQQVQERPAISSTTPATAAQAGLVVDGPAEIVKLLELVVRASNRARFRELVLREKREFWDGLCSNERARRRGSFGKPLAFYQTMISY